MPERERRIEHGIRVHAERTDLTVWIRADEERLVPTQKIRVTADDLSPDGFSFRHSDFLQPGTTVLAYVPGSPHAHLVETEVRGCTRDAGDAGFQVAVAVKGRSNRLPLILHRTPSTIPPA